MPTRDDTTTVQLKIRIKEPLRAAIERDAKARGVTMNTVIVDRLKHSFCDAAPPWAGAGWAVFGEKGVKLVDEDLYVDWLASRW